MATNDLKSYRQKGPTKTTRFLLTALKQAGVNGLTLLDVGGGVGIIQHELLPEGVATAVHIDASTAYLDAAQEEAKTARSLRAHYLSTRQFCRFG